MNTIKFTIPEGQWTPEQFGVDDAAADKAIMQAIVAPADNGWQTATVDGRRCTIHGMTCRVEAQS